MTNPNKLGNVAESAPNESAPKWEALRTVKFRGSHQTTENLPKSEQPSGYLKVEKPQKPVSELSPEEASKEYLDLLKELSKNFTNKNASYNYNGGLVEELVVEHEGQEAYESAGAFEGHGALRVADELIRTEDSWRKTGDIYKERLAKFEEAEQKLRNFQDQEKELGFFQKAFSTRRRRQERKKLEQELSVARHYKNEAQRSSMAENNHLKKRLESAYNNMSNEEANDSFFGAERNDKINRAIELRRKLKEEKSPTSPKENRYRSR